MHTFMVSKEIKNYNKFNDPVTLRQGDFSITE